MNPDIERKQHDRTRTYSEPGRSYCYITCPFCGSVAKAFIWSLCGGGKKCTCGAKHTGFGITIKEPPKVKKK